jgi:hypothetical protein
MTIPSNHEIGDEVWFLSNTNYKIRKGTIVRPENIWKDHRITWEIEGFTKNWDSYTETANDEQCFKTKEDLINFLTEE